MLANSEMYIAQFGLKNNHSGGFAAIGKIKTAPFQW
jgi:hypothetical protein|tara:strand:- start:21977 stop:22084 length:108 start_codon:yes stop_codon:yes gene_type:complete